MEGTCVADRAQAGYPDVIASTEYDDLRHGRIVYETPARRFVLYADRGLQQPTIIAVIKGTFGLDQAQVLLRSDSHSR